MLLGDFKQEILKLNNKVNMEMFGVGLRWQKIEVMDDKAIIIANNKRVKALSAIDHKDAITSKLIDIALILEFKERFIKEVENSLGIKALAHLKDYDPGTEISFSVTIFEKDIEKLIREI